MDEKSSKKVGVGRIKKSVKSGVKGAKVVSDELSGLSDSLSGSSSKVSTRASSRSRPKSSLISATSSEPASTGANKRRVSKSANKLPNKLPRGLRGDSGLPIVSGKSKSPRASLPREKSRVSSSRVSSLRASLSSQEVDSSSSVASKVFSKVGAGSDRGYWQGQMLLASPGIGDTRFERSIVYLCHQGKDGALGLVINKVAEKIQFTDVLDHLSIPFSSDFESISVHVGGPVESSRGFVLHSPDKKFNGTIELGELAMTASADILKHIAAGKGPKDYVFLLGYAGWGTGQLDKEIASNAWLHLPFDSDLIFGEDNKDKWSRAMDQLGISPHLLSGVSGNA